MKQGWEIKQLHQLSKHKDAIVGGPFGSNLKVSDYKETGIPILRLQNIGKGHFVNKDIKFVSSQKAEELSYHSFNAGDIALAKLGIPIGKTCIIPEQFKTGIVVADVIRIRPDKKIVDYNYLVYYLNTDNVIAQLTGNISGATRPRVNLSDVRNIDVSLPNIEEQQRIVSILDKAFTAIDKAKANAEHNLKNAKELFESYLQSVFENKGENWVKKEFGELITTLTDYHANGSYEILKENVELKKTEDFAWMVRSTDFENNFQNNFRYIDEESYNFLSKSKVFGGEIIMSKIGNAGNVYLMPRVDRPCSLAMNLFLIRIDENQAIPEFVYLFLKTNEGESQIKARLLGMATKTITKENVRNIIISYPKSKKNQQILLDIVNKLQNETKKLEAVYKKKIEDLEEFKKSILQKAFSGKL